MFSRILKLIRNLLNIALASFAFISTFYAIAKLMLFLSRPIELSTLASFVENELLDSELRRKKIFFTLSLDLILIVLFIFQHSLMKANVIKTFWRKIGMEVAERSIYNIATSWCLLLLVEKWQREASFVLWNVNVANSPVLWWTFTIIHTIAWAVIYGGSLLMDFCELIGMKQVYYSLTQLNAPMSYKSPELRRILSQVRHPSFTAISTILWATNCMSLDRLALAVMWTLYMYLAWNMDPRDVQYQRHQLIKKKYELSNKMH